MLNEQRRIPEEQEYFIRVIFWKFLSSSVFLPLSWWNFRMLQQFCVCVWERKQLTQSKDNSKLQLNDRLGAPVVWIALFSFYSCMGGGLVGKKKERKKPQLGQKASSSVSGDLLSAQTKIAVIFCWQTLFNVRVFFCEVGLFLFSYLWQCYHSGTEKGWRLCVCVCVL